MAFHRAGLTIQTDQTFYDITDDVALFASDALGHFDGYVHVMTLHTTTGLRIMEMEPRLLRDIERAMEQFAPRFAYYHHDDIEHRPVPDNERLNAYSHLRSLFFATELTVPVENGRLMLGEWQRIAFAELDPGRERTVMLRAIGDTH